jgi:pimeloyl-ACP methyl ester carboxylesterase
MRKQILGISLLTAFVISSIGCGQSLVLDQSNFSGGDEIFSFASETETPVIEKKQDTTTLSSLETFINNSYRMVFEEYDKNKSGSIEANELPEAPNSFKQIDKDKNNRLTLAEVMPPIERMRQITEWGTSFFKELQKELDTDKDGLISKYEITSSEALESLSDSEYWERVERTVISKNTNFKGFSPSQFTNLVTNFLNSEQRKNMNMKVTPRVTRSNDIRPVILVQGYAEPSWYFMYGIYHNLKKNGWDAIYPVNLFPTITDIKEQAKIVAKKIEQAKKEQGVSRVDYIAHSMGGLIGRYYTQNLKGANNIEHLISISTPHYGTYVAWAGIGEAAKQMRPGSDFLNQLNNNPLLGSIKYTSIWTKTDEIVIPAENAILRGSNVLPAIENSAHMSILWMPETYRQIKTSLFDSF